MHNLKEEIPLGPDGGSIVIYRSQHLTSSGTHPAVLVCPGGSYTWLNIEGEGHAVFDWLSRDITPLGRSIVVVLRYRLPTATQPWPAPLEDLETALKHLCVTDARVRWGIDPNRIVLLGFSAGAHLAAQVAATPTPRLAAVVLLYPPAYDGPPGQSIDTLKGIRHALRIDNGLDHGVTLAENATSSVLSQGVVPCSSSLLPPFYIVSSTNDRVCPPIDHADRVVAALHELGARIEYQRQRLGAHGFGVIPKWTKKCAAWLRIELLGKTNQCIEMDTVDDKAAVHSEMENEAVSIAAIRTKFAGLNVEERAAKDVTIFGNVVGRRQGRAPRIFLDIQAGLERIQVVVELASSESGLPNTSSTTLSPEFRPGVSVTVRGNPGRVPGRGALAIFTTPDQLYISNSGGKDCMVMTGKPCKTINQQARARFHMSPRTTGWQTSLGKIYCGAYNDMKWAGELPLPNPPTQCNANGSFLGCWLLPATDEVAIAIAKYGNELTRKGWRVLTCNEQIISRLNNKWEFRKHAETCGVLDCLPIHYTSPDDPKIKFPCMMKGAEGNHGQNVKIIKNLELLKLKAEIDWSSGQSLLQVLQLHASQHPILIAGSIK